MRGQASSGPATGRKRTTAARAWAASATNDRELWFADPRIGGNEQLPDRFYNKDRQSFDKGHIVRREDVAWGATYEEMRNANGDTFHVTNCSPQVLGFNRSSEGEDNWGDLENHVLAEAGAERLAVFAGPVLADDDPIFAGVDAEGSVAVRIPRRFWKLIVAEKDGRLMSFGFKLEQDFSNVDTEFAVPDRWREFMASVGEIEDLADVDFAEAIRAGDQSFTDAGARVRARGAVEASGPPRAPAWRRRPCRRRSISRRFSRSGGRCRQPGRDARSGSASSSPSAQRSATRRSRRSSRRGWG